MDASARWTPRRTQLAGLGALVGGVGGLLGSFGGFCLVGRSLGDTGTGFAPWTVVVLYPVGHVLFAVGLLAAGARCGFGYGRRGPSVSLVLAVSLFAEAGTVLVLASGRILLGGLLIPLGILHAATYLAVRLFGSLYGSSLWRRGAASRPTAALFAVLFPSVFVLAPLTRDGFPGALVGAPLYLAFVALGYELWTVDANDAGRETAAEG